MSYAAILTPVADDDGVERHLAAAVVLAEAFAAVLVGSAAELCLPRAAGLVPMDAGELVLAERAVVDQDLAMAETRFRRAATSVRSRWICDAELPLQALLRRTAMADLVVMGRMPRDRGDIVREIPVGDVVMKAGRPVLVVGDAGLMRTPSKIAIAWKNCREARRAVADALPLLKRAETVIAYVAPEGGPETAADGMSPLIDYLQDHGVRCTGRVLPTAEPSGDAILLAAAKAGAELIVAGAYGRSRLQEWAFGGVTSTLLARAGIPVLFSH